MNAKKRKNLPSNSNENKFLQNDDEVCIPSLSSILLAVPALDLYRGDLNTRPSTTIYLSKKHVFKSKLTVVMLWLNL